MAEGVDYYGLAKRTHKGFCLAALEKLMKYWSVVSYLVINNTPIVPGGRPLISIRYKYNSRKVLGFISTEAVGSTEPGYLYLSSFSDMYYNVSVRPVVIPFLIGGYFNSCNKIDNKKRTRKSDIELEKYWVTHNSYFRLATTVALGMGITDGKLLFCYGVLEGNVYNKNSIRRFNIPFPSYFGCPYLNLP